MGRRSRKRGTRTVAPAAPDAAPGGAPRAQRSDAASPHAAPPSYKARPEEAPKAPWSPFPLVELCVLGALVLIVAGLVTHGRQRAVLLACGIALACAAGLELSIREHFAGYRSHSALLAGAAAVAVAVPLYLLTGLPQVVLLAVGVLVYSLGFLALRRAFQARTGGIGFRV
jgi:hypothetical protein